MTVEELELRTVTVSPEDLAERLGNTPDTLANWRWRGDGPPYVRVGRRIRYRLTDLAEWLDAHTRTSTSDTGSDA